MPQPRTGGGSAPSSAGDGPIASGGRLRPVAVLNAVSGRGRAAGHRRVAVAAAARSSGAAAGHRGGRRAPASSSSSSSSQSDASSGFGGAAAPPRWRASVLGVDLVDGGLRTLAPRIRAGRFGRIRGRARRPASSSSGSSSQSEPARAVRRRRGRRAPAAPPRRRRASAARRATAAASGSPPAATIDDGRRGGGDGRRRAGRAHRHDQVGARLTASSTTVVGDGTFAGVAGRARRRERARALGGRLLGAGNIVSTFEGVAFDAFEGETFLTSRPEDAPQPIASRLCLLVGGEEQARQAVAEIRILRVSRGLVETSRRRDEARLCSRAVATCSTASRSRSRSATRSSWPST